MNQYRKIELRAEMRITIIAKIHKTIKTRKIISPLVIKSCTPCLFAAGYNNPQIPENLLLFDLNPPPLREEKAG